MKATSHSKFTVLPDFIDFERAVITTLPCGFQISPMNLDLENLINSVGSTRKKKKRYLSDNSASQLLKKWWVAERMAPILLPYQQELLDRILAEVRRIRDHIEETSLLLLEDDGSGLDPILSRGDVKVQLLLIETELERVKFIARAYKRARMVKIDRHAYFYLQNQQNEQGLMSKDEWIYCHRHAELLAQHYHTSFLGSLPEELQDLTDTSGHVSMIEAPDLDKPVTIKVIGEVPGGGIVEVGGEPVQLVKNNIYLLRYSAIAELLDYVELI